MKLIIAGGRDMPRNTVVWVIHQCPLSKLATEVLSGKNKTIDPKTKIIYGADYWGEQWAIHHGIPVKPFPADWDRFGKGAGPIRNAQMAKYADALLAIWNGSSSGTGNMIECARDVGLRIWVFRTDLNQIWDYPDPNSPEYRFNKEIT